MKFKSLLTLTVLGLMVAIPNMGLGRTIDTAAATTAIKHELKGGWAIAPQYSFSSDGSKVLTMDRKEGNVYIWNTADGSLLETLKNDYRTSQVAWGRGGKSLIVYGVNDKEQKKVVTLWDVSHL